MMIYLLFSAGIWRHYDVIECGEESLAAALAVIKQRASPIASSGGGGGGGVQISLGVTVQWSFCYYSNSLETYELGVTKCKAREDFRNELISATAAARSSQCLFFLKNMSLLL